MAIETEQSLNTSYYFSDQYFSDLHLMNLCSIITHIHSLKHKKILEIGIGNGFVSKFLNQSSQYNITTFDINKTLKPDIVGNLISLPTYFSDKEFDFVICSEVLEHLPFEDFKTCLMNIKQVSQHGCIITLPSCRRYLFDMQLYIKLPYLPKLQPRLSVPLGKRQLYKHHEWELYSHNTTNLKNVIRVMNNIFISVTHKRISYNYYHHLFLLQ